jgi:F-type H+-transporting ATPase subunit b
MTIDWWTLGLQAVNVIALVWLLGRFFWRPLAGMIEQRRAATQAMVADAEGKRAEATAALTAIETTRAGFAQERDAILAAAHAAAVQTKASQLKETAKQSAILEAAVKATIEKEKNAAESAWAERSGALAIDIAKRLATRLDGSAVRDTFLNWLLKAIGTLPDLSRQTATTLEAVTATPLELSEQERCRTLIAGAFGSHPQIAFTVDDTLIAGLELKGAHFVVRNSWRADFAEILADLNHDS